MKSEIHNFSDSDFQVRIRNITTLSLFRLHICIAIYALSLNRDFNRLSRRDLGASYENILKCSPSVLLIWLTTIFRTLLQLTS